MLYVLTALVFYMLGTWREYRYHQGLMRNLQRNLRELNSILGVEAEDWKGS